jgi:hypothetical protein
MNMMFGYCLDFETGPFPAQPERSDNIEPDTVAAPAVLRNCLLVCVDTVPPQFIRFLSFLFAVSGQGNVVPTKVVQVH